jgi:hypothetical protein
MTKTTKSGAKPSADEAGKKALEDCPGATAEGVASAAGIGRSTATKTLARLVAAGEVTRHEGGRDGGRRLPDRFTLAGTELPPAYAEHTAAGSLAEPTGTQPTAGETASKDSRPKASEVAVGQPSEPAEPKATDNSAPQASSAAESEPSASSKAKAPGEHLKPGQLDGLVLAYLKENPGSGPHGPTTVAKALGRSSGAVGNCLVRLTKAKQVRQDSDKPRRYSLAA